MKKCCWRCELIERRITYANDDREKANIWPWSAINDWWHSCDKSLRIVLKLDCLSGCGCSSCGFAILTVFVVCWSFFATRCCFCSVPRDRRGCVTECVAANCVARRDVNKVNSSSGGSEAKTRRMWFSKPQKVEWWNSCSSLARDGGRSRKKSKFGTPHHVTLVRPIISVVPTGSANDGRRENSSCKTWLERRPACYFFASQASKHPNSHHLPPCKRQPASLTLQFNSFGGSQKNLQWRAKKLAFHQAKLLYDKLQLAFSQQQPFSYAKQPPFFQPLKKSAWPFLVLTPLRIDSNERENKTEPQPTRRLF